MRKWIALLALVLLAVAAATTALAQDSTRASVAAGPGATGSATAIGAAASAITETGTLTVSEEITVLAPAGSARTAAGGPAATTITIVRSIPARPAPPALLTMDLSAGFPLDPFFVSVNGGGATPASEIDPACTGFVNQAPVLTVHWSGQADFVNAFVFSDHDPSLIVGLPDGTVLCNDDAGSALLDPELQIQAPPAGDYQIWVGSERKLDLIPAVLVLTTRRDFDVANFQLDRFVQRESGLRSAPRVDEALPEAADVEQALVAALAGAADATPLAAGATLTVSTQVTGLLPGFLVPAAPESPQPVCSGLVDSTPQLTFEVDAGVELVRAFFESNTDATLLLVKPDGTALCADDSADGANRNPSVDLVAPEPGTYAVIVGRVGATDTVDGILTVTTDGTLTPALLAAPAGEEMQP